MSDKLIGAVALTAIAISWTTILSSNNDDGNQSVEDLLAAGADPTEIFEPTASGGINSNKLACDDISFGNAKGNIYARELGGNILVSNVDGFKAFELDEAGLYANEILMNDSYKRLQTAFNECEKPSFINKYSFSLLTKLD